MEIKHNILILLVFMLCFSTKSNSQQALVDSLRTEYKKSTNPEEKLYLLQALCNKTRYSDFETALICGKKGIELAQQLEDVYKEAEIHNDLGLAYTYKADFNKAFKELTIAENLFNELGNQEMVGVVYNNFGLLFNRQNNYGKELTYHHQALDIFEKLDLPTRKAMSYVNIGKVYIAKKDHKTAADYFVKAYHIYDQLDDKNRIVTCLNNIAAVYMYAGDYELSNIYFNKNLQLLETMEDVDRSKAMVLYNSTNVLLKLNKLDLAESRLTEALILCKKLNDKESLSICYHNFGGLYMELKKYTEAKYNYLQSLELCIDIGFRELEIENYKHLAIVYENTGDYEKAYKNYTHYTAIKDSIFNKQIESINEVEKKYLEEKSAREIETLNLAKQEEEHQANIIKVVSIALILVLFSVIFSVVLKYRDKKKSNLMLEEKNREITDSITYAKRIQSAILPPDRLIKELLPNSFILYKPKDIVAGDFYWMEALNSDGFGVMRDESSTPNTQHSKLVLFAAADCTGHGVPGAMVSVICNNGLNRSVREYGLTDPGAILDKTREIVIEEFSKSEDEVKDGMDIALCSLRFNVQCSMLKKQTRNLKPETSALLEYAGAHNPLWIIRDASIIEFKANKQPIGQYDSLEPYTTHSFELQKGDTIYIFSDGYVDQFGGEKGKKFKTVAFRALLLSIQEKNMEEQKILIDDAFENWKGKLEQIDDVCIIGVRI